ncbi:hypothetical protein GEMRC1_003117 [Eukaryota sp. GEM-RC1]
MVLQTFTKSLSILNPPPTHLSLQLYLNDMLESAFVNDYFDILHETLAFIKLFLEFALKLPFQDSLIHLQTLKYDFSKSSFIVPLLQPMLVLLEHLDDDPSRFLTHVDVALSVVHQLLIIPNPSEAECPGNDIAKANTHLNLVNCLLFSGFFKYSCGLIILDQPKLTSSLLAIYSLSLSPFSLESFYERHQKISTFSTLWISTDSCYCSTGNFGLWSF